jgi:hypothetical protein
MSESIQVYGYVCNLGKAAEEFKRIGQFIIKAPVYRSKATFIEKVYASRTNEEICTIKKAYLQHWLLKGIDSDGLVNSQHQWYDID